MIDIKAELTPMRLSLAKKEPIELMVELNNNSGKTKMITMEIVLDNQTGFDKQGRTNIITRRFDAMKTGERVREYFQIFPKTNVEYGDHKVIIGLIEHFNSYNYVLGRKTKELTLIVQ
jgi:hypothetical protein